MSVLEPKLEHNREEDARLVRKKRQLLLIVVLSGFPLALLVPYETIPAMVVVLLAVAGAGFLYLEARRTLVFRRDLRERRELNASEEE